MKSLQPHSLTAGRLYADDMLLYSRIETAQDYQKLQNDKFHSRMDICKLTTSTLMQASANPCSYLEVFFNIQSCQFVVEYMNKWNEYLGMLPIGMV